ncbi:MAG: RDD family protein [Pseudomonadales bacterium]|nr:RDD family protein [Pseudomonadales bacterium]
MLDTYQQLETPESIDLELRIAGPVVRILAFLIDFLIRVVVWIFTFFVTNLMGNTGIALFLLVFFFLEWIYPVLFEVYFNGQTIGKKAMGILVIHDNGTPVGWNSAIIRNLLRFVDFLPMGYVLGLITMVSNQHFKRLGDYAAGTLVIYQRERVQSSTIAQATPLPPPKTLTLAEQRAFINFAERQHSLTPERQREIANNIAPFLKDDNQAAVDKIIRIANWLKGAR